VALQVSLLITSNMCPKKKKIRPLLTRYTLHHTSAMSQEVDLPRLQLSL